MIRGNSKRHTAHPQEDLFLKIKQGLPGDSQVVDN